MELNMVEWAQVWKARDCSFMMSRPLQTGGKTQECLRSNWCTLHWQAPSRSTSRHRTPQRLSFDSGCVPSSWTAIVNVTHKKEPLRRKLAWAADILTAVGAVFAGSFWLTSFLTRYFGRKRKTVFSHSPYLFILWSPSRWDFEEEERNVSSHWMDVKNPVQEVNWNLVQLGGVFILSGHGRKEAHNMIGCNGHVALLL